MKLRYGNFVSDSSECNVTIKRTPKYTESGQQYSYIERWDIQGFVQAETAALLGAALLARKNAFGVNGQSIALLFDDGSMTNHALDTNVCLGGIRVVEGVSFPGEFPTEYAPTSSFRVWTASVEGEVVNKNKNYILAYHEALTHEGEGGPIRRFLQTLVGKPQGQTVTQASTYRVVQEGECVGMWTYPPPNPPIWPGDRHFERTRFWKRSPKLAGPPGQQYYTEWVQGWHYEFESVNPFIGVPILQTW